MGFNKTIQMCIFDGNPNGRIMCELSNWNGRVYKISRNDFFPKLWMCSISSLVLEINS